jgi:hypothetical protein
LDKLFVAKGIMGPWEDEMGGESITFSRGKEPVVFRLIELMRELGCFPFLLGLNG